MYCRDQYSTCLTLLNDCITLDPNLSVLYSNRAVTQFHLNQPDETFNDLKKAISINPLDYVARFNAFSVNMIRENKEEAFQELCLSLSGAYLALGRVRGEQEWLHKAVEYSFNNK